MFFRNEAPIPLRASARYLEHAGVDPSQEPPPAILARGACPLRSLIAQWWDPLEPEDTLGALSALVEETLLTVARGAAKLHPPVAKRAWIQKAHFALKPQCESKLRERYEDKEVCRPWRCWLCQGRP